MRFLIAFLAYSYDCIKTGNTVLDTPKLEATVRDITEHCRTNFNQTLMQAAETVMAAKK